MKSKRSSAAALALLLLLSLCGCGKTGGAEPSASPAESPSAIASAEPSNTPAPSESPAAAGEFPEAGQLAGVARQLQGTWEMISGDVGEAFLVPERYGITCTLTVDGGSARLRWEDPEREWDWTDIPILWYNDPTVWEGYVYSFMFGLEPEEAPDRGFYGWLEGDTLHLFSWSWGLGPDMDVGAVYLRRAGTPGGPALATESRDIEDYVSDEIKAYGFQAGADRVTVTDGVHSRLETSLEALNDSRLRSVITMVEDRIAEYEADGLAPEPELRCVAEVMRADERFVCILYTYLYERAWHDYERYESVTLSTPTGWEVPLEALAQDPEAVVNAILYQLEQDPDREFFDSDWRDIVTARGLDEDLLTWYLADGALHVIYNAGVFTDENFPYPVEAVVPMGDDGALKEDYPIVAVG